VSIDDRSCVNEATALAGPAPDIELPSVSVTVDDRICPRLRESGVALAELDAKRFRRRIAFPRNQHGAAAISRRVRLMPVF
jgi:hypothetical protein